MSSIYVSSLAATTQYGVAAFLLRRDKYNKKIRKYHVDYESDDEDEHVEEEREKEEETVNTTNVAWPNEPCYVINLYTSFFTPFVTNQP